MNKVDILCHLYSLVQNWFDENNKKCKISIEPYGSYKLQCDDDVSDIDVVCYGDKVEREEFMEHVGNYLRLNNFEVVSLPDAFIPILKIKINDVNWKRELWLDPELVKS